MPSLHAFIACALDLPDDPSLVAFHDRARQLTEAHGPLSHLAPGLVIWTCEHVEDALTAARELLAHAPDASCALHLGEPTLTLPSGHALPVGPHADTALDLCRGASPGQLVLADGLLDVPHLPEPRLALDDDAWAALDPAARADATCALVERAASDLFTSQDLHVLTSLVTHTDRILAVVAETASSAPGSCARILVALAAWLRPLWMRPEALDACASLVASMPLDGVAELDTLALRARLRALRALQLRRLGELDASRELLEDVVDHTDALPGLLAHALNELALLALSLQDRERAVELHERVLALLPDEPPHPEQARAHKGLAVAVVSSGTSMSEDNDAFIFGRLERALAIAQACSDRQLIMLVAGEWANILSKIDPSRASSRMADVLTLARLLHVDHFVFISLSVLTDLAIRLGHVRDARELLGHTRAELPAGDLVGRWFVLQQEALICLYEKDFDRASTLAHELRERAFELQHPQLEGMVDLIERFSVLLSGQLERFKILRDAETATHQPYLDAVYALGDAILAHGEASSMDALDTALRASEARGRYDEWNDLAWRHAIARFPERYTALRERETIAVSPDASWLVNTSGERVEVAHRPYIHRLLRAFVDLHLSGEDSHLDTHALFEIGWPGERIRFETMKNRVYVGISKLRGFGLKPWLLSGPDGYSLSRELCVVVSD